MPITDRAYVATNTTDLPGPHHANGRVHKWITVVATEEAGENVAGFWAEIRANPDNAELEAINPGAGGLWKDFGPFLAPLVRAWNATARELRYRDEPAILNDDGTERAPARRVPDGIETVELPPPAEAGWQVLMKLDSEVRDWLHMQCLLSVLHALDESGLGKKDAPSGDTPDGTHDGATITELRPKSRRARASSSKPAPSISV